MEDNNEKKGTCECDHCHCQIPVSAALSPEGAEYIFYFCGPDCLKKWQKENKERDGGD